MAYWGGDFEESKEEILPLTVPERSEWKCFLVDNVWYTPNKGKEPNRFHRWMQQLCFGVRWVKTKK